MRDYASDDEELAPEFKHKSEGAITIVIDNIGMLIFGILEQIRNG